ncbi:transposase [Allorhodopirellula heiligendammensis]|uniref:transposase n=1 Tax=Allorhodopirellula heiligendammensis TaxID=2714739 RepID=UPI0011B4D5FD|nr:transposase [Allorhodopirellula heiligendammensis]
MPRQNRDDRAGQIYHALNRGNQRQEIFHKPEDFQAFIRVLAEGLQKYSVELFSFTLMPNHWHLVLRPVKDGQMGRLLRWVTATHTLRYRGHCHSRGGGHLYQGRFKSFPIADDEHFYVACRYVERNPLRAKLVDSAKDWQHGSLHRWNQPKEPDPAILSRWPIPRLRGWNKRVDTALTAGELKSLRTCVDRSRPYGSEEWVEEIAERQGLWHPLRPAGRPRKRPRPQKDIK